MNDMLTTKASRLRIALIAIALMSTLLSGCASSAFPRGHFDGKSFREMIREGNPEIATLPDGHHVLYRMWEGDLHPTDRPVKFGEGRIEDGECEGPWVFYHPFKPRGTRPLAKGTMVKGQFHGDTTFHWPNGSVSFRCHLVHGKADGRVERYWVGGKTLSHVSEWKMGRLVSEQKLR